jgi:hypothetical protein
LATRNELAFELGSEDRSHPESAFQYLILKHRSVNPLEVFRILIAGRQRRERLAYTEARSFSQGCVYVELRIG